MREQLKIAVCDDDQFASEVVQDAIQRVLNNKRIQGEVYTFNSVKKLEQQMQHTAFDLLMLDIEMPGIDGISFGRKLREQGSKIDIVYVSNREDKVFESLRVNPWGFIRKKHFLEDVQGVMEAYLKHLEEEDSKKLILRSGDNTVAIAIDEICYIEGNRKEQEIWLTGQENPIPVRSSMQDLERELTPWGFLRVHKGYLVNYRYIHMFKGNDIILEDGTAVPVSRRKMAEVKEQYMDLMQEKGNMIL